MKPQTLFLTDIDSKKLIEIGLQIKEGAVAVIPTDTIYGIVGPALNPKTVEKIFKLRKRASSKPMIILIGSLDQILDLGVKINLKQKAILKKIWPGAVSIVMNCKPKGLHYLHRGKKSLAFRLPNNEFLLNLLKITGPLVSPSANFEGEFPALNISSAKKYFKDSVSFYIDAGDLDSKPSTVAKLEKDERSPYSSKLTILREGAAKIPAQFLK